MKVFVQLPCSKCEGRGIDESLKTDNPTNPPLCARCEGSKIQVSWIPIAELISALKAEVEAPAANSGQPAIVEVPAA